MASNGHFGSDKHRELAVGKREFAIALSWSTIEVRSAAGFLVTKKDETRTTYDQDPPITISPRSVSVWRGRPCYECM